LGLFVNYPSFLPDLDEAWIFSTDCRKILKYPISWTSVPMFPAVPCIQTDMTKLKVAIRNFPNVSKNHSQFKEIIRFFRYAVLTLGTFW
jgi:hypothetical protein